MRVFAYVDLKKVKRLKDSTTAFMISDRQKISKEMIEKADGYVHSNTAEIKQHTISRKRQDGMGFLSFYKFDRLFV